jgi:hypothetical protein
LQGSAGMHAGGDPFSTSSDTAPPPPTFFPRLQEW